MSLTPQARLPTTRPSVSVPDYLLHADWDDLAALMQRCCSAHRAPAMDLLHAQSILISSSACTPCAARSAAARLRLWLSTDW